MEQRIIDFIFGVLNGKAKNLVSACTNPKATPRIESLMLHRLIGDFTRTTMNMAEKIQETAGKLGHIGEILENIPDGFVGDDVGKVLSHFQKILGRHTAQAISPINAGLWEKFHLNRINQAGEVTQNIANQFNPTISSISNSGIKI